jgi:Mg-chelatase subunit ChlD
MSNNLFNQVDICFVVDTTGSMGGFIQAAQRQLLDMIRLLSTGKNIDLQVGLVEFRDHPPQDNTFVTRGYQLTSDLQRMQKVINQLQASGGGDGPEAVYKGVYDACSQMHWRPNSCRFVLLVGDAPPHGFGKWLQDMLLETKLLDPWSDSWKDGCPSQLNVQAVTALAENHRVVIHALCMGGNAFTMRAFSAIAIQTGGQCAAASNGNDVVSKIVSMLDSEFKNLEFDQQVLKIAKDMEDYDIENIADALASPRLPVAASVARLGKRGFL